MKMGDVPIHAIEGALNAYSFSGITLRQYYAGLAMQGLLHTWGDTDESQVAEMSVNYADALLAELEAPNDKT